MYIFIKKVFLLLISIMKKAIIVGASSGIGLELARVLVRNDYLVGITGRRKNLLEELKKENPLKYFVKSFDIKDLSANEKNLNELVIELGGLDLLIISSGTGSVDADLCFEIEKEIIDTNVSGVTQIAIRGFNYFKKQNFGHLVVISSIAGLRGGRFVPSYGASKAFQINFLEGLRQKSRHDKLNVTITDIRPGFVDTAMAKSPLKFWVAPASKAAHQIFKAIKKKKNVAYITKRWVFIAYIMKLIPKWIWERG
jgi:short-subunit dehydrogenase